MYLPCHSVVWFQKDSKNQNYMDYLVKKVCLFIFFQIDFI